jgi:cytochrome c oxidase cbb3-type subunit 2
MGIYSKPITFAVLSVVVILIGTIITMVAPMFMPSTQPVSDYIKPYTAIEIEGRDIYIREGCNNCHTQTVRPIRTEVARFGDYSKPEEFAYDRPFLWGSRRTGPDLNRVGGKYPDSWHYQHTVNPQSMFPKSNMPPYKWLASKKLNTAYSEKKIALLGYDFSKEEVGTQLMAYRAIVTSPSYAAKKIRDSVISPELQSELTELDALVAYLQKLGRDVKELEKREGKSRPVPVEMASLKNPFAGDKRAALTGKEIFLKHCAVCHGSDAKGVIGPDLTDQEWKYGNSDGDLYTTISEGRPGGMPNWGTQLGNDNVWKVISYIRTIGK